MRALAQTGACTVSEATFRPVGENTSGSGVRCSCDLKTRHNVMYVCIKGVSPTLFQRARYERLGACVLQGCESTRKQVCMKHLLIKITFWLRFQETCFNWWIYWVATLYTVSIFCDIVLIKWNKTLRCGRTIPANNFWRKRREKNSGNEKPIINKWKEARMDLKMIENGTTNTRITKQQKW